MDSKINKIKIQFLRGFPVDKIDFEVNHKNFKNSLKITLCDIFKFLGNFNSYDVG